MRKRSFHIWRLIFACFILATIGFFCVQGNLLIDFCSRIFVNADVLPSSSYSQVLGEAQELTILGVTATPREYNGEKSVEVTVEFSGVASGEDATVICDGSVSSADAGTQKYVTLSNFQITGVNKDNYSLPADINISPVFVDILPKETELIWQTSSTQYTYTGENQIATISAYYKDISNKRVPVEVSVRGYSLADNSLFVSEFKNAGNYTVKAIPSQSDSNYNLEDADGNLELTLKMNRAKPVLQVSNDRTFVYNGLLQDVSRCVTINNNEQTLTFKNNTFTTVTEGLAINDKGGVEVTAAQSSNYLEATTTYTIDVVKATAEIDVSNVATNYTYSGLLQTVDGATINNNEQTLQYSNNTFTTVAEGEAINAKGGVFVYANATENYKYVSKYVEISVDKKQLDITKMSLNWSATSYTYDGKMKEVKVSNYNDALLDVSYKNERNTEAGSYIASAVFSLRDSENYILPITTLTKEWSIAKREVTKPTVQDYVSTYTGLLQALPLQNGTYYSLANNMQTNAGVYILSYKLNDKNNTVWKDDKTTNDVTFVWTIKKAQVETPEYKSTVVFDGKNHSLEVSGNDLYTVLQTAQSSVGEYKTYLVLNDDKNYEWKEDPASIYLTLDWKIVENENYNQNIPIIAVAFMVAIVILGALYVTLHFTSVRRRKKRKVTVTANQARSAEVQLENVDAKIVNSENAQEEVKQESEQLVDNSQKTAKKSTTVANNKLEVKATKVEILDTKTIKEEKIESNSKVKNQENSKPQSVTKDKTTKKVDVETNTEKARKKRMLSRKKADKKKRKKVVVDTTPKKRGRPKKVEGQTSKKRTTKKTTKAKSSTK